MNSLIKRTDSYKVTHAPQYPPGTEGVFSFFESRGGEFPEAVFFGLQYYLKNYFAGEVITQAMIEDAAPFFAKHFGTDAYFNRAGWERIVKVHGGRLPVVIKAVPEGTVVPVHNVMMTIENTDPELPWLTNYLETILVMTWYPTTVATQSREMKKTLLKYLELTGDPSLISFKLHDFGFRGSTSIESAGIGGGAHLVNFLGTDTLEALSMLADFYDEDMAGFSIAAAEHSTITSWGKGREGDAYANMLEKFPSGIIATVSDSYNIYRACRKLWGERLHDEIMNRDGTLVIRPDSGNPPKVVVKVLDILGEKFGYTVNAKGYKVLPPQVRLIQGDGIDRFMLEKILAAMIKAGWSADNIAFGSGGGLLQKVNRDTMKFAFKCSAARIGGTWMDVIKDPITDKGKISKPGRLALVRDADGFRTIHEADAERLGLENLLVPVFSNGELLADQSLAEIRARAAIAA